MVTLSTQQLTRRELEQFLPSLRAVKAFEGVVSDLAATASAVEVNTATIEEVNAALVLAIDELSSARNDRATIAALRAQVDELRAIILGS